FPKRIVFVLMAVLSPAVVVPATDAAPVNHGREGAPAGPVTAVAFSPDGRALAVGRYRAVTLLAIPSGRPLRTVPGLDGAVTALAFSSRGATLLAATGTPGKEGHVACLDVATGRRLCTLPGPYDQICGMALSGNERQLAAASYDHSVSLWSLTDAAPLTGRGDPASVAHEERHRISKPAGRIAGGKAARHAAQHFSAVANSPSPRPRFLRDHTDSVYSLAFSPDGRQLATAAADRTVKMWDTRTGKRLYTLGDSTAELYAVAYRPGGLQIAAGGADKILRVWNVSASGGTMARSAFAHNGAILRVLYARSGRSIYTCGEDGAVKEWDADTLAERGVYPRQPDWPQSIALSHDDRLLAVGRHDGTLAIYDTVTRQPAPARVATTPTGTNTPKRNQTRSAALNGAAPAIQVSVSLEPRSICLMTPKPLPPRADQRVATIIRKSAKAGCPWAMLSSRAENFSPTSAPCASGRSAARMNERPCVRPSPVPVGRVDRMDLADLAPSPLHTGPAPDPEIRQQPGIDSAATAQPVPVPCVVSGLLWNGRPATAAPAHYYRFPARRGQMLVLDVMARRSGSPLDSYIEVLDLQGRSIERAVLRAVSQTELALRDADSTAPGIRLLVRPEFGMKDYVLAGREVIQIYAPTKGPDDDYPFRSFRGQRLGFFGTTPEFHTLGSPVYKVEVHPPGTTFSPNGMPLTHLYYKNDDGGPLYGRDSFLEFMPPADGDYLVRLTDARGQQGEKFAYKLRIHVPRPDFNILFSPAAVSVPKDGAIVAALECERREGFDGEITVRMEGLPEGFTATPAVIEAGETAASAAISAVPGVASPKPDAPASYRVVATATIDGHEVTRTIEPDNKARRVTIGAPSNVRVSTDVRDATVAPGGETSVEARITRLNGFKGRVPLDVRNLPYGVRVDDVGLNGVLIVEGETSRRFVIRCEPWVKPQTRLVYVTANVEGGVSNTALPLMLRVGGSVVAK
ncbi:MAG TPA: hypothetical protein VKT77_20200, partial [Chthonomonadaceae bacterium]|nr:hypothetical protein [Chthonomonadaceae bacterium]